MLDGSANQGLTPAPTAASAADDRQDDVMAEISDDGRPPPKKLRAQEWRWFAWGASLAAVGLATWLVFSGISGNIIIAGVLYGVGLLALASPVVFIGLTRAKEEREASRATHPTRESAAPR